MKTPEGIKETAIELFSVISGIPRDKDGDVINAMRGNFITGYINAYTQCQKDNEEKVFRLVSEITTLNEEIDSIKTNNKYTEEDVINALHQAELKHNKNYTEIFELMKPYLQSLNKK